MYELEFNSSASISIKLEKFVDKTGGLINRKIRPLVLDRIEFQKLKSRLDIDNALPIWNKTKEKAESQHIY